MNEAVQRLQFELKLLDSRNLANSFKFRFIEYQSIQAEEFPSDSLGEFVLDVNLSRFRTVCVSSRLFFQILCVAKKLPYIRSKWSWPVSTY